MGIFRPSSRLTGAVSRKTLLLRLLPAAAISYFGALILVIRLSPGPIDWRASTISKLALDPSRTPDAWIASDGIALAGILLFPFAGFMGSRLQAAAPLAARIGAGLFRFGAAGAFLTGAIAYRAGVHFPRLHTWLARGSAFALGLAMIAFWTCALKTWLKPVAETQKACPPGGPSVRRRFAPSIRGSLAVGWTLLVLAAPSAAALSALDADRPVQKLAGFYEWTASVIFFLFLLSGVLLLPEKSGDAQ